MPTVYNQGAAFERHILWAFNQSGYFCMRSAGSHSPVDLAAHNRIYHIFMQLKSSAQKKDVLDLGRLWHSEEIEEFKNLPINEGTLVHPNGYLTTVRLIITKDISGIKAYKLNSWGLWEQTTEFDHIIHRKKPRKEKQDPALAAVFGPIGQHVVKEK